MYCQNCGNPISDDARFCNRCGKPVGQFAPPRAGTARARLSRHLPVLALLWAIYSVLRMLAGGTMIFGWPFFLHGYFIRRRPFGFPFFGWLSSGFLLRGMMAGVGTGVLLLGALGVAAGWGLWHRKSWARVLALILGFLALLRFPLGTSLGIYTLWVMLSREAGAEYDRLSSSQ